LSEAKQGERERLNRLNTLIMAVTGNDVAVWKAAEDLPTVPRSAQAHPLEAALRTALESRHDYLMQKKMLEREGVQLVYAKNQALPRIDLVASYGQNGLAYAAGTAFGSEVMRDYATWSLGLQLQVPLGGNLQGRADVAAANLRRENALIAIKALEVQITNDIDTNSDGKVTLADWERGAFIVVNSWGKNWSKDGRIYLLYSAMVDSTWERGNFLGRIEVRRALPQSTLKLKLACNKRSDLRVTIGVARDENATRPDHEFEPQALNGFPLFGKNRKGNVGEIPLAGPGNDSPLEMGIDLTPLFEKLGPDAKGKGRLFLRFATAEKSDATGTVHACAIRHYDEKGSFVSESNIEIKDGAFSKSPLTLESVFR
jgi:hypothetical protein